MIMRFAIILIAGILLCSNNNAIKSQRAKPVAFSIEEFRKLRELNPNFRFSLSDLEVKKQEMPSAIAEEQAHTDEENGDESTPKVTKGKQKFKPEKDPAPPKLIKNHYQSKAHLNRKDCFSIESLQGKQKEIAEKLLLAVTRSDAIFTLTSDLKPVTIISDWYFDKLLTSLNQDDIENLFNHLHLGNDIRFVLNTDYKKSCCKQRSCIHQPQYQIFVYNRKALKNRLTQRPLEFKVHGITAKTHPMLVLKKMSELGINSTLSKHLQGYPIKITKQTSQAEPNLNISKVNTPSQILSTVEKQPHISLFAWSKENIDAASEHQLKVHAKRIIRHFMQHVHPKTEELGIVTALRDWYDNGNHQCSLKEAQLKIANNIEPPTISEIDITDEKEESDGDEEEAAISTETNSNEINTTSQDT